MVAVAACAALYLWRHPAGLSLRYSTLMGLAFAVALLATRALALERKYEVRSLSLFRNLKSIVPEIFEV